jgi:predicted NBD/HSP70 family sugar kinase
MRGGSGSSGASQLSVRVVVEAILHQGPISRARLAQVTGLSKQTTSEAVRLLEAAGWVGPRGRTQGKLGRSAIDYEIQADAAYVLGVDLGGAKIRAALADLSGAPVAETTAPTDRRGGARVIAQIGRLRQTLIETARIDPSRLRFAVVGTPGIVHAATGAVELAPNIAGLDSIDVLGLLRAALACDIEVENDVNLAALGEQWHGRGKGPRNLVFIALGTGLGMGLVMDGRLVRGRNGAAGEIGYLPIGADPFAAESRRSGALERAVGAQGIVARYEAAGGQAGLSVPAIFEKLGAGDAIAIATIDETARLLAMAALSVCAIVDPERIVLGGSIGARPELIERLERLLPLCMARPAPLARSALQERATIVGALATGLSRLHNRLFGVADLPGDLDLPPPPSETFRGRAA